VGFFTNLEFFLFISWFKNVFNYMLSVIYKSLQTLLSHPDQSLRLQMPKWRPPLLIMHMQVGYGGGFNSLLEILGFATVACN